MERQHLSRPTAAARYNEIHSDNLRLAARILATLESQDTTRPDWADVGDQGHWNDVLSDLSDALHQEGEYAPERKG